MEAALLQIILKIVGFIVLFSAVLNLATVSQWGNDPAGLMSKLYLQFPLIILSGITKSAFGLIIFTLSIAYLLLLLLKNISASKNNPDQYLINSLPNFLKRFAQPSNPNSLSSVTAIQCIHCSTENAPDAQYCINCGQSLAAYTGKTEVL